MAVRYISNSSTGADADANGDLWLLREGITLTNSGDTFDFSTFTSVELMVAGLLVSETDAIDSDAGSASNTVHVATTGVVFGSSDGIEMSGDSHTVINHGEVTGLNDRGIQVIGDFGEITNTGQIYGQSDGISLEGSEGSIGNSGTITSEFDGINVSGNGNEVVNTGTILGYRYGIEFNTLADQFNLLINAGIVTSGTPDGTAVRGDFGNETVINTGQINGNIYLFDGADVFDGRGGTVTGTVFGGLGDDLYIIDDAGIALSELEAQGNDEVRALVDHTLGANFEVLTLLGDAALAGRGNTLANTITGNGGGNDLRGYEGNDTIDGTAGDDTIYGGEGNDNLTGGFDNDLLLGGTGNDDLAGGNGDDTLLGKDDNDTLKGWKGDDVLEGGGGNDSLIGSFGHDTLDGGSGKDTLAGGDGDDLLTGGLQADLFVFTDGFGNDTIADFASTWNAEKIDLSGVAAITGFTDLSNNHMNQVGSDVVIDDGAGNTITLENVGLGELDAGDFLF